MEATHVRVTNGNDFPIDDRFDGVPYVFEPGKERMIPVLAAALFFGLPVDDNGVVDIEVGEDGSIVGNGEHVKRRWGWNNINRMKDEDLGEAVERAKAKAALQWSKIRLVPVLMALREVPAGAVGDLPEPRASASEGETVEMAPPRGKMKA